MLIGGRPTRSPSACWRHPPTTAPTWRWATCKPLGIHMYAGGGNGGLHREPGRIPLCLRISLNTFSASRRRYERGRLRLRLVPPWSAPPTTLATTRPTTRARHSGSGGIGVAVYLSLMGPEGMAELGRGIMQRACYAAERIAALPGVSVPHLGQPFFKEFVVDFSGTGKIGRGRQRRVAGGRDSRRQGPERRVPGAGPIGALLRDRATRSGRDRETGLRARGGSSMTDRIGGGFHAARWDEPLIDEIEGDGGRGLLPPKVDDAIADAVGRRKPPPCPKGCAAPRHRRCPSCRNTGCSGTSCGSRRWPWAST